MPGRTSFSERHAGFLIAHSHDMAGNDLGQGQDLGSSVKWHGDESVTVTVWARCGGCPNFGPSIVAALTYTLNPSGKVTVEGWTTQYPSVEIYQYGLNAALSAVYEHDKQGNNGAWGLSLPWIHITKDAAAKASR